MQFILSSCITHRRQNFWKSLSFCFLLLGKDCSPNWEDCYSGMYCWTFEKYNNIGNPPHPVLSISFEVDVPTGKVGGNLLFECRRRELPKGVWGHAPPRKFWNLDAWKCYFQRSPDSIWALRTIKIMLYKPYSMFITTVLFLKISITGF